MLSLKKYIAHEFLSYLFFPEKYTSDSIEVIQDRREELSNAIKHTIEKVETKLREKVGCFVDQKQQLE